MKADLEAALGPLAQFELAGVAEAQPVPSLAEIAAMSDADKLALRARLQGGAADGVPPEVPDGEDEGLEPGAVFPRPQRSAFVPPAGCWSVKQPAGAPPIDIFATSDALANSGGAVTKIAIFQ